MVAKHVIGKSFKGVVNYNAQEEKGTLIDKNFEAEDTREIIEQLEDAASLRESIKL